MGEFRMPSLGADMEKAKIVEWRVKPGDDVRRGDIVVVIDTEKSTMEVEIFETGVIEEILVAEGAEVPVGTVLARVGPAAAAAARAPAKAAPRAVKAPPAPAAAPEPERATVAVKAPPAPSPAPAAEPAPVAAAVAAVPHVVSPVVRHLAERAGLDLAVVTGSGPGGTITRADVERAARLVAAPPAPSARVPASPRARRLADLRGVELAAVAGSGPGGAVTGDDVERAAAGAVAAPPSEGGAPSLAADAEARRQAMRRAIANLMARSKREVPHYYLATTVDLGRAMAWLRDANAERSVTDRLLPSVLLLRATALALHEVPELNGFWVDDHAEPSAAVHLGVAIALRGGGLIAPAIHDADRLGLDELMAALRDLVARARSAGLRASEMADPTITVTNLGDLGVETVFPVIYPPQVAIVGFGRVVERPWAVDGLIGVRPVVTVTLGADHRASDGHRGGLLLAAIDRLLQEPEAL